MSPILDPLNNPDDRIHHIEEAPQSIRMKGLVMVPENPSLGTSRTDIVSEQNERQIQQHMPTISQDIHVREFHVSKNLRERSQYLRDSFRWCMCCNI